MLHRQLGTELLGALPGSRLYTAVPAQFLPVPDHRTEPSKVTRLDQIRMEHIAVSTTSSTWTHTAFGCEHLAFEI